MQFEGTLPVWAFVSQFFYLQKVKFVGVTHICWQLPGLFMNNLFFSCISLNVRGLKENTKRKSLFLFCKGEKAQFIFLQETHSKPEDENFNGETKSFLIMGPLDQQVWLFCFVIHLVN